MFVLCGLDGQNATSATWDENEKRNSMKRMSQRSGCLRKLKRAFRKVYFET